MGTARCAADVVVSSTDVGTTFTVGAWALTRFAEEPEGEPLVRDIDAAARLGFAEPRMIRKLIKRIWPEIQAVHVRSTVERTSMPRGGTRSTPVNEYWLTEAQLLKVVARSETKIAEAILDEMIAVYMAVRRHLVTPPSAPKPVPAPHVAAELPGRRRPPAKGMAAYVSTFDGKVIATLRFDDGRVGWFARTLGPALGVTYTASVSGAGKLARDAQGDRPLARYASAAECRQIVRAIALASTDAGVAAPLPRAVREVVVVYLEGLALLPVPLPTLARFRQHIDAVVLPALTSTRGGGATVASAPQVEVENLREAPALREQLSLPMPPATTKKPAPSVHELVARTQRFAARVGVPIPPHIWSRLPLALPSLDHVVSLDVESVLTFAVFCRDSGH